jgi:hypothetical protein
MDNFLEKFLYFLTVTLGLLIGLPVFLMVMIVMAMIVIELVGK